MKAHLPFSGPRPPVHRVTENRSEDGPRGLLISILLCAVADYLTLVHHGMVAEESWLAPSEKLKSNGVTVSKKGVVNRTNGTSTGCDVKNGGSIGMRETLEFFGGRRLDSICALLGICPDRVRSRMMSQHRQGFRKRWKADLGQ